MSTRGSKRMSKKVKFDDALEPTDYGFIVCGKTGRLKGLWIPTGSENDDIPESIVKLCVEIFGIDPTDEEQAPILH